MLYCFPYFCEARTRLRISREGSKLRSGSLLLSLYHLQTRYHFESSTKLATNSSRFKAAISIKSGEEDFGKDPLDPFNPINPFDLDMDPGSDARPSDHRGLGLKPDQKGARKSQEVATEGLPV